MNNIFSFDAETNGLWGQGFSIGALVYDQHGAEIARFVGRCPIEGSADPWVQENVLPQMQGIEESHGSYDKLLAEFATFYKANKKGADVVVHVGVPVEAKVLIDMRSRDLIGDWDGPFPLHDVSGNLQQAGEDPLSVDEYMRKHELVVGEEFNGGTHNPLYDSAAAAVVYRHLLLQK